MKNLSYPKTKEIEHVDNYHGIKVPDPYRWLENYQEPYARAGKSIFIYKLE